MVSGTDVSGNMSIDADTTTGLTLGYTAGYTVAGGVRSAVSAGTVSLTDDDVNWVTAAGTPTVNIGDSPSSNVLLYKVTTASAAITEIIDYRGALITNKASFT
jgi:hypothetical protein